MKKMSVKQINVLTNQLLKEDWPAIDRQINKDTGSWKRAQQQIGIPLSAETKEKISQTLTGRKLSSSTRAKISASLKAYNSAKKSTNKSSKPEPKN